MADVIEFQESTPTLESYWRSIILFGRNVASYKFALSQSLLELADAGKTAVTLEELADPYAKHLCEHLKSAPKQATSRSSSFLEACQEYNQGKIDHNRLITVTEQKGFNNVIDSFHVVNEGPIPIKFYEKDYTRDSKRIVLTDDIFLLREIPFSDNLFAESEARWNLVEKAWELNLSRSLLTVRYDETDQKFVADTDESLRRKDITSARGALNGYQKGKCFYCYDDISVDGEEGVQCDVDHFFPYTLQRFMPHINLNGVWNLVLACPRCNRGEEGKFARVPAIKYLERLHRRNEYLIRSHHPLRETIMLQTGKTEAERRLFLMNVDRLAINYLIHRWETEPLGPATF